MHAGAAACMHAFCMCPQQLLISHLPISGPAASRQEATEAEEEPHGNGILHQAVIPDDQPIPFADAGNPIMAQVVQLHISLLLHNFI